MNTLEDARLAVASAARLVVREAVGMTSEDVARIEALLEGEFNLHLADLNFDSLAEIGLCMHLERMTGIVIDPSELTSHNSLGAIAELVMERSTGR